jgi:recombinational DNA repair protein RecR
MAGTNISDKCAVRSRNGRLLSEVEVFDFWEKSMAACPTYGVCYWCFGSGPTNMYCQVCQDENRTYKILLTVDQVTIDAEWVLRFFGTTHFIAKADRTPKLAKPGATAGCNGQYQDLCE